MYIDCSCINFRFVIPNLIYNNFTDGSNYYLDGCLKSINYDNYEKILREIGLSGVYSRVLFVEGTKDTEYLDLFFNIYYLKLLSYSFSTLAILYQLTNLYLLKFFSYHEFNISNMLPNILKNWLREFEALNSSLESKIEYKNECYLQITIYIVILNLTRLLLG